MLSSKHSCLPCLLEDNSLVLLVLTVGRTSAELPGDNFNALSSFVPKDAVTSVTIAVRLRLIELSAVAISAGQCVAVRVQAVCIKASACMQVDPLDVAAAGVLEHAEPQLLTMLSGQLIAASSHKGAQEAERSGSIASAAAAAQVSNG